MKTAEELLKEKGITPETVYHNYVYVYRAACDLIGEAQKEGYSEAMRWKDPKEERPELLPISQDLEQAKKVKNLFLIYFDGCYGIDSVENTSNTFAMGVCKLDYKDNVLTVHLRRPGLLIGKGGCIIDALAKHLECKIDIVEVNLLK